MIETRYYVGSDVNGTFYTPKQVEVKEPHGLLAPFIVFIIIFYFLFCTGWENNQASPVFPPEEFSYSKGNDDWEFFHWSPVSEELQYLIDHHTLLRNKDQGNSVVVVQKALHSLNYYPDNPDGIFGPATQNAVLTFQSQNQLAADGVVGPDTLRALMRKLS